MPSPFPGHRNEELVPRGEEVLYFMFYVLYLQREEAFPFTQPLFTSCFFVAVILGFFMFLFAFNSEVSSSLVKFC